ncbi:MAG TPA: choice-of-anchor tandem repeat GloVer-containing protein [Candidatus Cybelea sp.]
MTSNGGKYGDGIVFSVTKSGSEKVLHDFGSGTDGQTPASGLTMYKGILYGTTSAGGKDAGGTVFSITTGGKERVVHSFYNSASENGTMPEGGLTALNGLLYGTTGTGGCDDNGTVFSMTTSGRVKMLYKFRCNDSKTDGSSPDQSLVAVKGVL